MRKTRPDIAYWTARIYIVSGAFLIPFILAAAMLTVIMTWMQAVFVCLALGFIGAGFGFMIIAFSSFEFGRPTIEGDRVPLPPPSFNKQWDSRKINMPDPYGRWDHLPEHLKPRHQQNHFRGFVNRQNPNPDSIPDFWGG